MILLGFWVTLFYGINLWIYIPVAIVGITIILLSLTQKTRTTADAQPTREIIREKETIREIVKIPCRHCGEFVPQEKDRCPNCGAPMR